MFLDGEPLRIYKFLWMFPLAAVQILDENKNKKIENAS